MTNYFVPIQENREYPGVTADPGTGNKAPGLPQDEEVHPSQSPAPFTVLRSVIDQE